ncbi:MAG: hypothetical protein ACLFWF_13185 [Alphaproteobacteria bacterium]
MGAASFGIFFAVLGVAIVSTPLYYPLEDQILLEVSRIVGITLIATGIFAVIFEKSSRDRRKEALAQSIRNALEKQLSSYKVLTEAGIENVFRTYDECNLKSRIEKARHVVFLQPFPDVSEFVGSIKTMLDRRDGRFELYFLEEGSQFADSGQDQKLARTHHSAKALEELSKTEGCVIRPFAGLIPAQVISVDNDFLFKICWANTDRESDTHFFVTNGDTPLGQAIAKHVNWYRNQFGSQE